MAYATQADFEAFDPSLPVPERIDRWLRVAQQMIVEATRFVVYPVDSVGAATYQPHIDALRDATCAAVAHWIESGVDPLKPAQPTTRVVASQTLSAVGSVSYDTTAERDAAAATQAAALSIGNEAYRILNAAGLLDRRVFAV